MTKWMLRIASLSTLTVFRLLAQDITGTWQGKLPVPQARKSSPGFPGSAVAIQGLNVKIAIPGIGGTYEGKLDAEAITLTEKWTLRRQAVSSDIGACERRRRVGNSEAAYCTENDGCGHQSRIRSSPINPASRTVGDCSL
jgi:hypothetical protein